MLLLWLLLKLLYALRKVLALFALVLSVQVHTSENQTEHGDAEPTTAARDAHQRLAAAFVPVMALPCDWANCVPVLLLGGVVVGVVGGSVIAGDVVLMVSGCGDGDGEGEAPVPVALVIGVVLLAVVEAACAVPVAVVPVAVVAVPALTVEEGGCATAVDVVVVVVVVVGVGAGEGSSLPVAVAVELGVEAAAVAVLVTVVAVPTMTGEGGCATTVDVVVVVVVVVGVGAAEGSSLPVAVAVALGVEAAAAAVSVAVVAGGSVLATSVLAAGLDGGSEQAWQPLKHKRTYQTQTSQTRTKPRQQQCERARYQGESTMLVSQPGLPLQSKKPYSQVPTMQHAVDACRVGVRQRTRVVTMAAAQE